MNLHVYVLRCDDIRSDLAGHHSRQVFVLVNNAGCSVNKLSVCIGDDDDLW
jgi:hypothetical protein